MPAKRSSSAKGGFGKKASKGSSPWGGKKASKGSGWGKKASKGGSNTLGKKSGRGGHDFGG